MGLGVGVQQAVQGQLGCAVGLGALLLLPGQRLLAHGVVAVGDGGKRRGDLLGRHYSAVWKEDSLWLGGVQSSWPFILWKGAVVVLSATCAQEIVVKQSCQMKWVCALLTKLQRE